MPHARTGLVAAAIVVLSAASAVAEPAVVQSKLNLRAGPGPAFATLAVLPPGTKVNTTKCAEEWCRVTVGRVSGYVSRDFLKTGAEAYASAAPPPQTAPAAPPAGPIRHGVHVWQWNDSDWRNDHWRRLEWHNRMNAR